MTNPTKGTIQTGTDLYLRDLSGIAREEVERDLLLTREDLRDAVELQGDIIVGRLFHTEDFTKA